MNNTIKKLFAGIVLIGMVAGSLFAQPITVTDVVGREVTIPAPAKRVILGEGRQLVTLSLLVPEPVDILAGWQATLSAPVVCSTKPTAKPTLRSTRCR